MSASANFFFCASRASLVFSAIAFPAATRLGFFWLMTGAGVVEVTCWAESTGCCASESVMVYIY